MALSFRAGCALSITALCFWLLSASAKTADAADLRFTAAAEGTRVVSGAGKTVTAKRGQIVGAGETVVTGDGAASLTMDGAFSARVRPTSRVAYAGRRGTEAPRLRVDAGSVIVRLRGGGVGCSVEAAGHLVTAKEGLFLVEVSGHGSRVAALQGPVTVALAGVGGATSVVRSGYTLAMADEEQLPSDGPAIGSSERTLLEEASESLTVNGAAAGGTAADVAQQPSGAKPADAPARAEAPAPGTWPAGPMLAAVVSSADNENAPKRLIVVTCEGQIARTLYEGAEVPVPAWRPGDPDSLAVLVSGELQIHSVRSGEKRTLPVKARRFWWSPDGRKLLITQTVKEGKQSTNERLSLLDPRTGAATTLATIDEFKWATWSPTGARILITSWGPSERGRSTVVLDVLDVRSGKRTRVGRTVYSGIGESWSWDGTSIHYKPMQPGEQAANMVADADGTHQRRAPSADEVVARTPEGAEYVRTDDPTHSRWLLSYRPSAGAAKKTVEQVGYNLGFLSASRAGVVALLRDGAGPGERSLSILKAGSLAASIMWTRDDKRSPFGNTVFLSPDGSCVAWPTTGSMGNGITYGGPPMVGSATDANNLRMVEVSGLSAPTVVGDPAWSDTPKAGVR